MENKKGKNRKKTRMGEGEKKKMYIRRALDKARERQREMPGVTKMTKKREKVR